MSGQNLSPAELENIRRQMLKFAQLQLRQREWAEDVVQEAWVSAYQHQESFQGAAAWKTWLFSILKNKIIDALRRKNMLTFSELEQNDDDNIVERLFLQDGEWNRDAYDAQVWQSEEGAVYSEQFWQIFEACLHHLPTQQARVFMMRSYLDMDAAQICQACAISSANLHTLLYRARLQLQLCLSHKWFGATDEV